MEQQAMVGEWKVNVARKSQVNGRDTKLTVIITAMK